MGRRLKKIILNPVQPEMEAEKHWEELREESIKLRFALKPLNRKQELYLNAIETSVLTFVTGPSGTAKTYLACWMAIQFLISNKVERIILSRPALECGEKIGHLPGTSVEKISGYLFPLIDALSDFLGEKVVDKLIEDDKIRLCPISLMRGSSFKNSIIVVDESQNLTFSQLKMLITRIGKDCTMVVSGDYKQSDLLTKDNDLFKMINELKSIPDISFINFTKDEVVRSGLVKSIINVLE